MEKENSNKDNYTEILPLYYVGNKSSVSLGSANFDRAIEKCEKAIKLHSIKKRPVWNKKRRKTDRDIEWLNRKEYNPMLWKAWLLLGRSQFHEGDFDGSAATFSYMSRLYQTQPAIYCKARAWLAKAYVEADWLYDAEDVIRNMARDSIHWSAQKEWNYTYTDYFIHTEEYEKAIPYLQKVIKREGRKKQKAREYYILGQLYTLTNNRTEAYKAYKRVIRQHPPYELQFNARIAMTEVMAQGQARRMVSKLRSMARNDNNKEYLDQVYYAIGNIYMTEKDTLSAISAYEKGNEKSVRNGIEKGVLLLRLGDIYWDMERYSDAGRCYGEAIGLLDKDRKDYDQLADRSKKLDELVPFTEAIHLQDSLQALALMSEKDRNEAIDRVIDALKKKEKEEKDAADRQAAEETVARNSQNTVRGATAAVTDNSQTNGVWYFYNQLVVNQGKQAFQKQWGKRENVDHWQRSNRTVVSFDEDEQTDLTEEQTDSISTAEEEMEALEEKLDSAVNDPHKREYYLAQIPFTDEQKEASDLIIMDGLYNSGVIFKDKLEKLALAEKQFLRLLTQYPSYEGMDNAFYHMFLLYSRLGFHDVAAGYIDRLKKGYPESQWTALLTDPYFADNQRFGVHMEDSLYAATYEAFKADRFAEIKANVTLSKERFPLGVNRDKFIFVGGLSKLNAGDADGCLEDMNTVVTEYPQSKLSEMAGMIVNGVKQGRVLRGGRFDIGNVWARRSVVLSEQDSIANREFTADPDIEFVFMIAYEPDSVDGNQLLYRLAKYNFTNYVVRNFDIELEDQDGLYVMRVGGFNNYYEAKEYAREFYKQENIYQQLGKSRTYIISRENMALLGTRFSYEDYENFYTAYFEPLDSSDEQLLSEPSSQGNALDDGGSIPGNISPILQGEEQEEQEDEVQTFEQPADDNTMIIEDDDSGGLPSSDDIDITEEEPAAQTETDENGVIIEDEESDSGDVVNPEEEQPAADDVIIIEDEEQTDDDSTFIIEEEETVPDDDSVIIDDDGLDIETEDDTVSDGDIIVIDDDEELGTEDESLELDGF